jgi:dsRNA-specific ribonuclease
MNSIIDDDIRIEKNANGTEIYVFDPYNPLNVEITKPEVEFILAKYGVELSVHNFELYRRAFVHQSYVKRPKAENEQNNIVILPKPDDCIELKTKSNERLEFVGDGILECITKLYLYKRFPLEQEGFMTEKKIALVKNEAIGKLAQEMGLHKWFILSKHAEEKQTRTNLKKLGCLFESCFCGLLLDFNPYPIKDQDGWFPRSEEEYKQNRRPFKSGPGFQLAQIFIENIFEMHVKWSTLIQTDDNFKNILQVRIQKEFKVTPHYMQISEHSAETGYRMGVYLCLGQSPHRLTHHQSTPCTNYSTFAEIHHDTSINGKIFLFLGEGTHKIKKKAEQIACEKAIQMLKNY